MSDNDIISNIVSSLNQPLWNDWYIKEQLSSDSDSASFRLENPDKTSSVLKIKLITANSSLIFDRKSKEAYMERKRSFAAEESASMRTLKISRYIVPYEDEDMCELIINGNKEGYYRLIRTKYFPDIRNAVSSGSFDLSEANILRLANHIAQALRTAHQNGVIHCDINLSNIFTGNDGIFRLGNFSFTKQLPENRNQPCIAPEVYHSKSSNTDYFSVQSDIYSLGICLYTLMNNLHRPFEDICNPTEAFAKRMKGEPLTPPVNASPDFARVIMKACQFDAQQRYKSISDMIDDLCKLSPASPKPVQPPRPIQPSPAPPQYINHPPVPPPPPPAHPIPHYNTDNFHPGITPQNDSKKSILIILIIALLIAGIITGIIIYLLSDSSEGGYISKSHNHSDRSSSETETEEKTSAAESTTLQIFTEPTTTVTSTTVPATTPPATRPTEVPTTVPAETRPAVLYRVRRSWADARSQIGAFSDFNNARAACLPGYTVFDINGNAVYSVPETTTSPHVITGLVITEEDDLNVRSGPGTQYEKIGTVPKDGYVDILSQTGGWYEIRFNGSTGYVSGEFIMLIP